MDKWQILVGVFYGCILKLENMEKLDPLILNEMPNRQINYNTTMGIASNFTVGYVFVNNNQLYSDRSVWIFPLKLDGEIDLKCLEAYHALDTLVMFHLSGSF